MIISKKTRGTMKSMKSIFSKNYHSLTFLDRELGEGKVGGKNWLIDKIIFFYSSLTNL